MGADYSDIGLDPYLQPINTQTKPPTLGDPLETTTGDLKGVRITGSKLTLRDDNQVNRVAFDPATGVFKLSQSGVNVLTATNDQLVWSSEFNSFKIVQKGTIPIVTTGTAGTGIFNGTLTHSLGYAPAYVAYRNAGNEFRRQLPRYSFTAGGATCEISEETRGGTGVLVYTLEVLDASGGAALNGFDGHSVIVYLMRETIS